MGNKVPGEGRNIDIRRRKNGWAICSDEGQKSRFSDFCDEPCFDKCAPRATPSSSSTSRVARVQPEGGTPSAVEEAKLRVEELARELFRLQDLKKDGFLEEGELIKLNQKIAMLHHGTDADLAEVKEKFKGLFRSNLDAQGRPVPFDKFRDYILHAVRDLDRDPRAQEMILEQWVAEAESARAAFFFPAFQSMSDAEFTKDWAMSQGDFGSAARLETAIGDLGGSVTPSAGQEASPAASDAVCRAATCGVSLQSSRAGRQPQPPPPGTDRASQVAGLTPVPSRPPRSTSGAHAPLLDISADGSLGVGGAGGEGAEGPEAYRVGDRVHIWSNSRKAWFDGVVEAVFLKDTHAEGYNVPAGTVKVTFSRDVKWVMPTEVRTTLRRASGATMATLATSTKEGHAFSKGSEVEVWSNTKGAWLRGIVQEAFDTDTQRDGFRVPAGTMKVSSAAGIKWILPDQVAESLRMPAPSVGTTGAVDGSMSSVGTRVPAAASVEVLPERLARGDSVEVWSDSRKAWVIGVAEEVFEEPTEADGFSVPAGAIRVSYEGGFRKWVPPDDFGRRIRKVDEPRPLSRQPSVQPLEGESESDLRAKLALALADPDVLQRQVEALMGSLSCEEGGLPLRLVPAALEGLSLQFGVRLDLEGDRLAAVRSLAEAFARDGDGGGSHLTLQQLCGLSRELVSEVYASVCS